jgi:hypothetical protein
VVRCAHGEAEGGALAGELRRARRRGTSARRAEPKSRPRSGGGSRSRAGRRWRRRRRRWPRLRSQLGRMTFFVGGADEDEAEAQLGRRRRPLGSGSYQSWIGQAGQTQPPRPQPLARSALSAHALASSQPLLWFAMASAKSSSSSSSSSSSGSSTDSSSDSGSRSPSPQPQSAPDQAAAQPADTTATKTAPDNTFASTPALTTDVPARARSDSGSATPALGKKPIPKTSAAGHILTGGYNTQKVSSVSV